MGDEREASEARYSNGFLLANQLLAAPSVKPASLNLLTNSSTLST
jgi:hypothetical protein